MNTKIILSLVVIAAVSAIAVGGTLAYFSDTETVAGNTFASATLSIKNNTPAWSVLPFTLTNFKPGDDIRRYITITNDGTIDIGSLKISATNKMDPDKLLENIKVAVYNEVEDFDQGIYSPDWGKGQPVSDWLTNVNVLGTPVYVNPGNTTGTVLAAGKNTVVQLWFRVPADLGNEFQGKSATFDIEFLAEQVH